MAKTVKKTVWKGLSRQMGGLSPKLKIENGWSPSQWAKLTAPAKSKVTRNAAGNIVSKKVQTGTGGGNRGKGGGHNPP